MDEEYERAYADAGGAGADGRDREVDTWEMRGVDGDSIDDVWTEGSYNRL